jgi:fatty acid-binding protein DegV
VHALDVVNRRATDKLQNEINDLKAKLEEKEKENMKAAVSPTATATTTATATADATSVQKINTESSTIRTAQPTKDEVKAAILLLMKQHYNDLLPMDVAESLTSYYLSIVR